MSTGPPGPPVTVASRPPREPRVVPIDPLSRGLVVATILLIAVPASLVWIGQAITGFEQYPFLAVASAVVWALFAIPFLLVLRRIDFFEHEPWPALVAALVWGAFSAIGLALVANSAAFDVFVVRTGGAFTDRWGAAMVAPVVEEVAKGMGILLILLASPRVPRTSLDGFVIGATVGLGFQIMEDFTYTLNYAAETRDAGVSPLIAMFLMRGLISGIFSHAVYSGIVGLGMGYLVTAHDRSAARRFGIAALALLGAVAAHSLWNSPLLFGPWGPFPGLFAKGLVTLLILWAGLRIARRKDADYFMAGFAGVDPALVSPQEVQAMASGRTRRAWIRAARLPDGRRATRQTRVLQQALADLAVGRRTGNPVLAADAERRIAAARRPFDSVTVGGLLPR